MAWPDIIKDLLLELGGQFVREDDGNSGGRSGGSKFREAAGESLKALLVEERVESADPILIAVGLREDDEIVSGAPSGRQSGSRILAAWTNRKALLFQTTPFTVPANGSRGVEAASTKAACHSETAAPS